MHFTCLTCLNEGAQTGQELNFIKVMVSDGTCPETVRAVNDHLQTSPSVLSEEY